MSDLPKSQTCPYCGYVEDDSYAMWEEGQHDYTCSRCDKEYLVEPQYKFIGFDTQKICEGCDQYMSECWCEEEESA